MSDGGARCFLCGGRALEPTDRELCWPGGARRRFRIACGFCGVLTDRAEGDEARAHLERALGHDRFVLDEAAPYGLDAYTLRTAATRWRRAAVPVDGEQRDALLHPHSGRGGDALVSDLVAGPGASVAIGLMCRSSEWEAALASLRPHLAWAAAIVILVDGTGADLLGETRVRVARRPMGGDFAGQRNALQDQSPEPWMLQLDADETLATNTGALLPALAALADERAAVSIGLPRRNLVDGTLADLYPDTQYRLNRREVRYAGTVHERPDRPWQRSLVALHGAIDHHLTGARVRARSQGYEAMAPGRGRLEEEDALLRPYRP